MKKLFIALLLPFVISCSSNDDDIREEFAFDVEVLDYGWRKVSTECRGGCVKVSIYAEIHNDTNSEKSGRIILIRHRDGNNPNDSNTLLYSKVFTVPQGETTNYSEVMDETISVEAFEKGPDEVIFELEENIRD